MSPRERIPIGAVAIAVETRLGAFMIRSLCIFLVLSCVVGLTGLMTGNLWNRYAEENALPRLGGITNALLRPEPAWLNLPKAMQRRRRGARRRRRGASSSSEPHPSRSEPLPAAGSTRAAAEEVSPFG